MMGSEQGEGLRGEEARAEKYPAVLKYI
jgi:hypothetical protein